MSSDGCNRVVGQVQGEGVQPVIACAMFGDVSHSVWLQNYPCNFSPDAGPGTAADRRLVVRMMSLGGPATFVGADWYPHGRTTDERLATTTGTSTADVFQWGVRMRGVFDVTFGTDRVCGCFDAPMP